MVLKLCGELGLCVCVFVNVGVCVWECVCVRRGERSDWMIISTCESGMG